MGDAGYRTGYFSKYLSYEDLDRRAPSHPAGATGVPSCPTRLLRSTMAQATCNTSMAHPSQDGAESTTAVRQTSALTSSPTQRCPSSGRPQWAVLSDVAVQSTSHIAAPRHRNRASTD
jgi:hypothetical protein